jgi:AraC family transcriptional regulator
MAPPTGSRSATPEPRQPSWLQALAVPLEPTLLATSQAAAWAGFRLSISQAVSSEAVLQGRHAAVAMILKGRTRARFRSRGEDLDVSPGRDSIGLFAPRLDVDWTRWECEPGAERVMIELDLSDLAHAGDLDVMLPARRSLEQDLDLRDARLASLLRLVADEVRQGSPHGALYATSLSLGLAAYLFTHQGRGGRAPARERGLLTAAQKSRVLELVQSRLAEDLQLDDLAAAAGVSRFHFLRLFKNSLGMTPHRFVLDQRVAAARRLLEHTSLSLADVAAATGFSSQSHLSTAMRRTLGLPPGKWRRAVRP